ncbi:TonB-dependent receptor [Flavivirga rizhaonensis]|uniref:TonB-dependent receptor n=1 Tax=Flavivirga rizhaonensis TaxID=2559571 RepID=A0A4S1DRH1_9FLAO|nr:TonB-dependent receptor [Flavivirga rizhaonensis]TGV00479.1 TonB-dependent receptor [Flavivirga rizhaonensis]
MRYLIILFISVLSFTLNAQSIMGKTESDGRSLPYVNIYLKSEKKGAVSNEDGSFKINNVKAGTYTIIASFTGYQTQRKTITMSSDNVVINFDLPESELLEEVVVTGTLKPVSRIDSPVPVEVYTPAFFKKNPTPSIFEALQNVNGVRPQLNCGLCNTGDIHINGLEGPYTLVLIDGMPIVSGLSTVYGLSGIPNSLVERVEIVKGPASSLYGSEAVAGLVNVITKKPGNAPLFSADVFGSSWGEFNFDLGGKFKLGSASSLLGVNYFNYNQRIDNNKDGYTDLTLQDRISVFNKWSFERKSGKAFSIAGRFFYEDRWGGENNWNPNFRGGNEIYGESIYTTRGELFGLYELPTTEDIDFTFSATTHDQNSFYGNTSYNAQQYIVFGQTTWNRVLGKHDLLVGVAGRYNFYDDNTPATRSQNNNTNKPDEIIIPSVFLQNQWKFAPKHELLAGLRYDYDDRHGNIITPRLAYKFAPTKNDAIRFNMGTGFRVVNLFTEDHAALTGSREVVIEGDLDPEKSVNFNINYLMKRYLPSGTFFTLETSAWYTYFSNRINPDYDTNVNQIRYANSNGNAISQGVSLQADINFGFGLKAMIGTSLQEVANVENGEKTKQPLTEGFNANWGLSYFVTQANLLIDFTGNLYGPMRLVTQEFTNEAGIFIDDPRDKKSPYWSIMNIQLTYDGFKNLEIYGGVKNLLDWIPAKNNPFVISRGNDPFEKTIQNPQQDLSFDTTYVYTSLQGIRSFLGIRYNLF